MRKQTALADSIDITNIRAQYDEACKRLLSNKYILAWILKSTMREFENLSIKDIAKNYIEGLPEISNVFVNPGETNINITGMDNEDMVYNEGKITY